MKIRLILLPLFFAAHGALADDMKPAPGQVQAGMIQHHAAAQHKARKHIHHVRHYTHADLRTCLDHKDNKSVIHCAEKHRRHK